MKLKGYTYLLTILIITIIIIALSVIVKNFSRNAMLFKNQEDFIISKNYSESILNEVLESEGFKDKCKYLIVGKSDSLNLDTSISAKDLTIFKLKLLKDNTVVKYGYRVEVDTKYKDIKFISKAMGSLIDEIYTKGISVINPNTVSKEEINRLEISYEKESELSKEKILNLENYNYFVRSKNSYTEFYREEPYIDEEGNELIKEIIDYKFFGSNQLYIKQRGGSLVFENEISINGIIDVDNICLESNSNINGVLKLNNEIIQMKDNAKLKVNGITINTNGASENNIISNYSFKNIENAFYIIPDVVNPKINSIKIGYLEV